MESEHTAGKGSRQKGTPSLRGMKRSGGEVEKLEGREVGLGCVRDTANAGGFASWLAE